MESESKRRPDKAKGRKRDSALTATILNTAAKLLVEVGFDKFRIQEVARRAGSGTGAIYRRWPTKEALMAEAIRNMPAASPQVTDDPVADLRAIVYRECASAAQKPDLVPGLISAMRSDSDIESAVKAGYNLEHMRKAIARIIGEDNPHLNLLTILTSSLALHRAAFTPESIDAQGMTDDILALILSFTSQNQ